MMRPLDDLYSPVRSVRLRAALFWIAIGLFVGIFVRWPS